MEEHLPCTGVEKFSVLVEKVCLKEHVKIRTIFQRTFISSQTPPHLCVSQVLLFNVCTVMAWTAVEISFVSFW